MTECEGCAGTLEPLEARSREEALRNLLVGEIFHASALNGASLICQVTELSESVISARRLLTGGDISFDRSTGQEIETDTSVIDSVEPLPRDIFDVITGLDRRYRLSRKKDSAKLTAVEIDALSTIGDFYEEHPL